MKKPALIPIAFALTSFICLSFAAEQPNGGATPGATGTPTQNGSAGGTNGAAPNGAQPAQTYTEPEILGMVIALEERQIEAAQQAMQDKLTPEAKEYAKAIKNQNQANQDKARKLGKKLGMKPIKNDKELEISFVDAAVKQQSDVLQILETQLMPAAKTPELKAHLQEVRDNLSAQLELGKRLQSARASR